MPTPSENRNGDTRPGPRPTRASFIIFLVSAVVVLGVDLASKTRAFARVADAPIELAGRNPGDRIIPDHDTIIAVPKVLAFKLTLNRGAAFGLAQGGRWVFIVVAVAAVAVIGSFFWKSEPQDRWLRAALALMLAGALGNLYDRIRFGMVRDFMWLFPDVPLPFGWTWPGGNADLYPWIFNVADAAMCVAVVLVGIHVIRGRRNAETPKRRNAETA